jgi:hypothetical protein
MGKKQAKLQWVQGTYMVNERKYIKKGVEWLIIMEQGDGEHA